MERNRTWVDVVSSNKQLRCWRLQDFKFCLPFACETKNTMMEPVMTKEDFRFFICVSLRTQSFPIVYTVIIVSAAPIRKRYHCTWLSTPTALVSTTVYLSRILSLVNESCVMIALGLWVPCIVMRIEHHLENQLKRTRIKKHVLIVQSSEQQFGRLTLLLGTATLCKASTWSDLRDLNGTELLVTMVLVSSKERFFK